MTSRRRLALAVIVGAVVIAILILRVLSFGYPMHTDARVYAYVAERLLDGQLLYRDVWEDKAPSFYYFYALVFAVGGARTETLIVTRHLLEAIGLGLLYLLLRRLYGGGVALVGLGLAGLFSSTVALQRATLMAEHPMLVFVLLSLLLLAGAGRPASAWWLWLAAGGAGGMALTFKQSAGVILVGPVAAVLFAAWRRERRYRWARAIGRGLLFSIGVLVPTGMWLVYFWQQGALSDLHAVLGVSQGFAETMSGKLLENMVESAQFMAEEALLWLLAAAWIGSLLWAPREDRDLFVAGWLLTTVASVVAAGSAFSHYLIAVVPALAAAAAVLTFRMGSGLRAIRSRVPLALPLLGLGAAALLVLFVVKQVRVYDLMTRMRRTEAIQDRVCETAGRLLAPGDTMYEWASLLRCWRVPHPTRFVYYWTFRFVAPDRLSEAFGGPWSEEVMRDLERKRPRVILIWNERDRHVDDIRPFPALAELVRREYRLVERFTLERDGNSADLYVRAGS